MQVAFLPIDSSGYHLGPSLPDAQQPQAWQQAQLASAAAYSGGPQLSREDFVAAIVTDKWHEELAQSSRLWRQVSQLPHCDHPLLYAAAHLEF